LIGVSGAGKTTLSRFVAWMNGLSVFQIKVSAQMKFSYWGQSKIKTFSSNKTTRLSAAVLFNYLVLRMRRLFEGCALYKIFYL
jgi:adenylate kinase family enzyme